MSDLYVDADGLAAVADQLDRRLGVLEGARQRRVLRPRHRPVREAAGRRGRERQEPRVDAVNQAEIDKIPAETRSQIETKAPFVAKPPASTDDGLPGSSEPYVTQQQYDQEWGEVPDTPTGGGGLPFGDDGDGDDFPIDPEDLFP